MAQQQILASTRIVKCVKDKAPEVKRMHCFLHKHALASKNMSEELHDTLHAAITCVNYVEARPLNQCFFSY